jgi:phenylacetate-coenzyme A ligase PaaK-like adenylate-forming protein
VTYTFNLFKAALRQKRALRLSRGQIKQLQQQKFLKLAQFAAEHSPYYRRVIREHGIDVRHCRPEDFPVLTKPLLIEYFDEIVTDRAITKAKIAGFLEHSTDPSDLLLGKYTVIHTSGSSGTVGYYVYSQSELVAGLAASTRANGLHWRQTVAYVGATHGHFAGVTMLNMAKKLPLLYKQVQLFDINAPFAETIEAINEQQPMVLGGYAFALRKLAEAQRQGSLRITPAIIQSGGEPLSTADKDYIQTVFGAPVVNVYASSEHLLMGLGRDSFGGMYLMEDSLVFELQPAGARITNLYNYTLPLIRYQMSDHLEPMADATQIMPFTKVKEVVGRQEAVPVFLNDRDEEDFISPILLVEFFVKGLAQFQIVLESKRAFVFRACLEPNLSQAQQGEVAEHITAALQAILAEKLMTRVTFKVELHDQLRPNPRTGKFALIVHR